MGALGGRWRGEHLSATYTSSPALSCTVTLDAMSVLAGAHMASYRLEQRVGKKQSVLAENLLSHDWNSLPLAVS